MSNAAVITARVSSEVSIQLEMLAKSINRSKSWLVSEAVQRFLQDNAWQIEAIKAGIKDIEEGRFVEGDKVEEWLNSWGTQDEKKAPL